MHKTIAVLLGVICLSPVVAHADEADTTIDTRETKTLFLTMTIGSRLKIRRSRRGTLLVNWKPPAATCVPPRSFHLIWRSPPDTAC